METPKSDDLFDLIHCLSPSQKGFFSKFAQRHELREGNNYEQLFQIFCKMPSYDADFVAGELKRLGIASPLPAAKNHLKTIVLRAMREYNSGRDTHTSLLEGLQNLAFLYEKKQYDLLRKELRRLKKVAEMHSEFHILFKIGEYERLLHKETARRDIIEGMEEILSEMQALARSFQNQLQFHHLQDKIYVIANKAGADQEQALNALLATELLGSEENATTLMSRIYYHQIHATGYMIRGQLQAAQRKYGAVLSLWEGAPHLILESPTRYRRVLSNYLQICIQIGDYGVLEELLAKVRQSPAPQPIDKAEIFSLADQAELQWRMTTYDWDAVAAMIPSLSAGLATHGELMRQSTVLTFQFNVAVYYFLVQDFTACNQWLREITEAARTEQRLDIQRIARIMGLCIIWERGDWDLLEYELRSASRYFENWGGGALEQVVLSGLQKMMGARVGTDPDRILEEMEQGIAALPKPSIGRRVLLAWLRAKRSHDLPIRTIMEIEE